MFSMTTEAMAAERRHRCHLWCEGRELTYANVIDRWQSDEKFQDYYTSVLAAAPFDGYLWETPALTDETCNRAFQFVLSDAPDLVGRPSDRQTFSEYFSVSDDGRSIVRFPNLAGDAQLVVPTPNGARNYSHIAAFVRQAPLAQSRKLWQVLGRSLKAQLSSTPIWVSTSGGEVAWLHVRIDTRPKYYSYKAYAFHRSDTTRT